MDQAGSRFSRKGVMRQTRLGRFSWNMRRERCRCRIILHRILLRYMAQPIVLIIEPSISPSAAETKLVRFFYNFAQVKRI